MPGKKQHSSKQKKTVNVQQIKHFLTFPLLPKYAPQTGQENFSQSRSFLGISMGIKKIPATMEQCRLNRTRRFLSSDKKTDKEKT